MSVITIKSPDGRTLEINAPDGATPDQIHQAAISAASHYQSQMTPQQTQTPLQQFGQDLGNSSGVLGTANTLLKAPEKMSRQGLQMISKSIPESVGGPPTGNLPLDVLKGTPRVLADTAAEVAPGFISKGAILTSGALSATKAATPFLKLGAKGLGSQLESLSGAKEGSLEAAYKAPVLEPLQLQPGKAAAGKLYNASKNELPFMVKDAAGLNPFKGMIGNKEIVSKAQEILDSGETMLPQEAIQARKAADALAGSRSINKDALIKLRSGLDEIAKQNENIEAADSAYKKGLMADSLRQIVPQNMHGGASAFKMAVGTALNGMGPVGKVVKFALSPAALGAAATVAGDVSKVVSPVVANPEVGALMSVAKNLDTTKATELLKQAMQTKEADGNMVKARQIARQMAIDQGYTNLRKK